MYLTMKKPARGKMTDLNNSYVESNKKDYLNMKFSYQESQEAL